ADNYLFKERDERGGPAASFRGRSSVRNFAEDRTPADDAALRRRIVGSGAVHDAAVVPGDELACLPAVLVGEVGMDGERIELLDQLPSLVIRHADDVLGVIAEIDALSPRFRMGADDRLVDRRFLAPLLLRH